MRSWFLAAALATAALQASALGAGLYTDLSRIQSFDGATAWLNSPPLDANRLRGKVVLVDFWEYTCINCLKALPYEKAWYSRYHRLGFELVGIHTPEFAFSGQAANVAPAVKRLGISWPVALDDRMTIWDRYHNEFWPHAFLIDQAGRIVYDHVGEGDYPDTERQIQRLLLAGNPRLHLPAPMDYLPQDAYAKPGAVCYPHTAETYAGDWRGDGPLDTPPGYALPGEVRQYADSTKHDDGRLYLQGAWRLSTTRQALVHARATADASDYIGLPYHAIQVVAVLRPEFGSAVRVYVEQDGATLARQDAGKDIHYGADGRAYLVVDAPREYDIVMNQHFGHRDLRLRPVQSGLGVYAFDFESCEIPK